MSKSGQYEKIAAFLAERYVSVQETKTASGQPPTLWDRVRPENPERPGANWWTGLGVGSLAAGGEIGIGRHGLTDTVQRLVDQRELRNNPFARMGTPEFRNSLAADEPTRLLGELFRRRETETGSAGGREPSFPELRDAERHRSGQRVPYSRGIT